MNEVEDFVIKAKTTLRTLEISLSQTRQLIEHLTSVRLVFSLWFKVGYMRFQEPDVTPLSPFHRPRPNDTSVHLSPAQQPTTPSRLLPLSVVPNPRVAVSHAPSIVPPLVRPFECSPHMGSSVPRSRSFPHQSLVQRPKISPSRSFPYPRAEMKTLDQRCRSKYVFVCSLYALVHGHSSSPVSITPLIPPFLRVRGQ
jgi:hypothetical protein